MATGQPVIADACKDKIAAMFEGGPLDAYQRPAHRHEKQVFDSEGKITLTFLSIVENPLRTISGIKGGDMTLTIDDETWIGPDEDGPWTASENNNPKDRKPWHLRMQAEQARNLSKTECEEKVEFEGQTFTVVRYTTKTDPNPDFNNAFFGSSDTAYIDPDTQQIKRLEQTGFFSSWLPEPGKDTHVTWFTYDPSIQINTPM